MKITIAVLIAASINLAAGFAPVATLFNRLNQNSLSSTQLDVATDDESNGKSNSKRKLAFKVSE